MNTLVNYYYIVLVMISLQFNITKYILKISFYDIV